MKHAWVVVSVLGLAMTTVGGVQGSASADSARSAQERVVKGGALTEVSGMARSQRHRGVLWMHNDSGHSARVYAVDSGGATRATVTLRGARNVDWEDMVLGRGRDYWVGDIGDNARKRKELTLYRFREPRTLRDATVASTAFRVRYPDGAKDAETLMVNRRTGNLVIVTKSGNGNGGIYRAKTPLKKEGVTTLQRIGTAPATITAGDYKSRTGTFVLRDYNRMYVYSRLGRSPRVMTLPSQPQGEAITYAQGGTILIASEGRLQPVWRVWP